MNKSSENKNKIPPKFLAYYFFLSIIFCYLYYVKIVAPVDWNAPNSINAVATFETSKPYQFRLLVPVLFKLFMSVDTLYGKYIYIAYSVAIVFLTIIIYYKILSSRYFTNNNFMLWISPVILYAMLWNYVILNQSFQYYDFTAIFFFTAGLYFIVNENFIKLLIIFIPGIINKETAVYLIFAYLLYNYRSVLTRQIIVNTLIMVIVFCVWKIFISYLFKSNPGDDFEIGFYENIKIIEKLFTDKVLMKNFFLNFGGLYIFIIILFISGKWKLFREKELLYVNLTVIPYYILGIFVTYITEVRVYTELIPLITTVFLIYLSLNPRLFGYFYINGKNQLG
ncbi:MAG: hypothetical protein N2510_00870 [Ignavibacteria bacterium]|nr:hypothetical protein [Ignavibacteria bacterium]